MSDERVGPCRKYCAVVDECDARGHEIRRLRAENAKLREERDASRMEVMDVVRENEKLREERQELKNELAKWVHFWRGKDFKALSAENEKLRAALKPFAELAEYYDGEPDAQPAWYRDYQPKVGELHAAKSALGESDE